MKESPTSRKSQSGHSRVLLLGGVVVALAASLSLTSCSAPSADSSGAGSAGMGNTLNTSAPEANMQTFTNPSAIAPATAEQAVADATAAFTEYRLLYNYILTHEGAGGDQVSAFMTTGASAETDAIAGALADGTIKSTGVQAYRILTTLPGENVVGQNVLSFQAVAVVACYDNTALAMSVTGEAVVLPPVEQVDAVLTFEPDANNWRISFTQPYIDPKECS
jgi:hypothetical protein